MTLAFNGPVAVCPACGLTFKSRAFSANNVTGLTLSGNRESCPQCGSLANVQNGVFNVRDGIWSLVNAVAARPEQFEFISAQLEALRSGQIQLAESIQNLNERIPETKGFFANFDSNTLLAVLSLLVGLLSFNRDAADDGSDRVERAILQVSEQIDQIVQQQVPSAPARPQGVQLIPPSQKAIGIKNSPHPEGNRAERRAKKFQRRK